MRGKVNKVKNAGIKFGITPAYAGKSNVSGFHTSLGQDHPRLCGEKVKMSQLKRGDVGSPPPMRGKVHSKRIRERISGDHPRLCGEKRFCRRNRKLWWGSPPPMRGKGIGDALMGLELEDHPRLCGEKCLKNNFVPASLGSPPPMRGKVILWNRQFCNAGITPAYAGKSKYTGSRSCRYRDHPRLCGEKPTGNHMDSNRVGSPPPMRGKDQEYP